MGERGTGKTTLALAIAAEAKVPLVEVKAQQLEAGLWVGQSASNVRELFQTARDLVSLVSLHIALPLLTISNAWLWCNLHLLVVILRSKVKKDEEKGLVGIGC